MTEKARRGFAAMSVEQRTAIAKKGGLKAQSSGRGHRYTSEEAQKAARKSARVRKQKAKQLKGAA